MDPTHFEVVGGIPPGGQRRGYRRYVDRDTQLAPRAHSFAHEDFLALVVFCIPLFRCIPTSSSRLFLRLFFFFIFDEFYYYTPTSRPPDTLHLAYHAFTPRPRLLIEAQRSGFMISFPENRLTVRASKSLLGLPSPRGWNNGGDRLLFFSGTSLVPSKRFI